MREPTAIAALSGSNVSSFVAKSSEAPSTVMVASGPAIFFDATSNPRKRARPTARSRIATARFAPSAQPKMPSM